MRYIFIILFCSIYVVVFSQNQKIYKIKAGEEIGDVLSFNDIYKYPSFKPGIAAFHDGRVGGALMNYNFLNAEIDFIDGNGDTLSLADVELIKWIAVDKDTFSYDNGYYVQIKSHKTKKLALKQELKLVKVDKLGAYDQPVYAGVDSYGGLFARKSVKLVIREDITLMLQSSYYIGERQKFYPFNRTNVMKLYSKKTKQINQYLDDHKINFSDDKDLNNLFEFLIQLEN